MAERIDGKSFIKNVAGFSVSTWVSFAISFLAIPIITRLYSTEEMGKINLFTTIVNLLCMLFCAGQDQAYTRFYYYGIRKKDYHTIFSYSSSIVVVFGLLVSLILLPFYKNITLTVLGEESLLFWGIIIATSFSSTILRLYGLHYRMGKDVINYSVQAILIAFLSKITLVISSIWDTTYHSALILYASSMVILAVFYIYKQKDVSMRIDIKNYDWKITRKLLAFGVPLIPASVIAWANTSLTNVIVKEYLDFSALGIYSSALSIASLINIVQAGFNTYWTAYVYENYQDEKERIGEVHYYITFVMVLGGLLIILLQDFIFLLLGHEYRKASTYFAFLLVSPICYTISETTGLGITIAKKTYNTLIFISASLVVNVILAIILIPRVGALGSAIASAIAGVVYLFIRTILGERYYKCVSSYRRTIFSLILLFGACFLNYYFSGASIIRVLTISVVIILLSLVYKKQLVKLVGILKDFGVSFIKRIH